MTTELITKPATAEQIQAIIDSIPAYSGNMQTVLSYAEGITEVKTQEQAQQAVDTIREVNRALEDAENHFSPFKGSAYVLHKTLCAREKTVTAQAEEQISRIKKLVAESGINVPGFIVSPAYSAEITDKEELLLHIVLNAPEMMSLISIDQKELNKIAAQQKTFMDIPGVKLVEGCKITVKGAAND